MLLFGKSFARFTQKRMLEEPTKTVLHGLSPLILSCFRNAWISGQNGPTGARCAAAFWLGNTKNVSAAMSNANDEYANLESNRNENTDFLSSRLPPTVLSFQIENEAQDVADD